MAPTQSKMAKLSSTQDKVSTNTQAGKLWNHEPRMFGEKFFYLNKSTTKYGITGLDAELFEPVFRICDRATGCFITIKQTNFDEFARIVSSIVDGTYALERSFIKNSGSLSGIKFYSQGNDIWKLCQTNGNHSTVLMHRSSFKTFARMEQLIRGQITALEPGAYLKYIEELRVNTEGMDEAEIFGYLNGMTSTLKEGTVEYQVIFDLISNRDSYIDLTQFSVGFYSRNKYL